MRATESPFTGFAQQLQFGFVPPEDDPGSIRRLEDMGADSLWVGGHIAARPPSREAIVGLTRLAVESQRAMIGSSVLLLPLYSPAIVAKQLAEIDILSGGRTVLGVGVGGEYPAEFSAVQVPLAERGKRSDEAIPLLRELWSGDRIDHSGAFFPMQGVRIHPGPVRAGGPPIVVAGRQPAAMRRAATLGDGWMPYMYTPRRYRDSVSRIRETALAAGRSLDGFGWFLWATVCVRDDPARARREMADFLGASTGQDLGEFVDRVSVAGDAGSVTARLREFVQAGVRHFVFATVPDDRHQTVNRLVEQVIDEVRAAPSSAAD
jgi:probable F420-dependent oxidoreductase